MFKKIILVIFSLIVLIQPCINLKAEDDVSEEVNIEPRGPYYIEMAISNNCGLGYDHTVDYGSFGTNARLDLNKTTITFYYEVGYANAIYYYTYEDVNEVQYKPFFEGYSYVRSQTYAGNCGDYKH